MIEIRKSLNPKPDGFKLSLKTILGVAKRQIDQCGETGSDRLDQDLWQLHWISADFWLFMNHKNILREVIDLPLWKMMEWKSVGMMKLPLYGKIIQVFQSPPTRYQSPLITSIDHMILNFLNHYEPLFTNQIINPKNIWCQLISTAYLWASNQQPTRNETDRPEMWAYGMFTVIPCWESSQSMTKKM